MMLFQSTVPDVIRKLNIQADSKANLFRKMDTAKRLDFFYGRHLEHLNFQLDKMFSEPEKLPRAWLNIVKKIINNQAQTYKEPPVRTIDGTERDQEIFIEIARSCALDVKLKQASRLTKLLKTILIRPVWRGGRIDIDLLTGNILDVETGDTPEELRKVVVTDFRKSNKIQEIQYSLWTLDEFRRLDYRGNTIKAEPNPYGVLPFLPVFDYSPTGSDFWLHGGDDLVAAQEAINMHLVGLLHTCQMQGFGVGWIKGAQGAGSLRVDPGSLVELPAEKEAAIGFESQKAPLSEMVESLNFLIQQTAIMHGLSASAVSSKVTEESGVARLVSRAELEELRRDDVALWRSYEHGLFNLIRSIWNTHNPGRKISDQATLSIDFADPKPVLSDTEKIAFQEKLLGMGVISAVDIALERNPDLKTREDALAYLLQIELENLTLTASPQT